jgi:hypothetical protein
VLAAQQSRSRLQLLEKRSLKLSSSAQHGKAQLEKVCD